MKLSIAIPSTSLLDEKTQLDKSRKISLIARTCAIFKIETIYIYQENNNNQDNNLFATILKYLDTPPFLRRRLFPKVNELKYAGVLHPLKIPSHITPANPKNIMVGDIRDGVVSIFKGKKFVDVGINQLIPYYGKESVGKRITIQFKKGYPELTVKEITREDVSDYWGYTIKERSNLFSILSSWQGNIILTSKKGKIFAQSRIQGMIESKMPVLVVFGAPDKGIHEILGSKLKQVQNFKTINFFPNQATETVRLEEALLGTLSIINLYNK